jgi:hypothetical protein
VTAVGASVFRLEPRGGGPYRLDQQPGWPVVRMILCFEP